MGECGGLPFSPFTCFIGGLQRENYFFAGNFAVCIDKSGGMGYDYSGGYFINVPRCVLREKCFRFLCAKKCRRCCRLKERFYGYF